jgi:hypothetical protein
VLHLVEIYSCPEQPTRFIANNYIVGHYLSGVIKKYKARTKGRKPLVSSYRYDMCCERHCMQSPIQY